MTVLVAALVIATAVGPGAAPARRTRAARPARPRGHRRRCHRGRRRRGRDRWLGPAGAAPAYGDRVLLLQLSSPVCTPCRRTAELIDDLRARRPGVAHSEVDVAERPEVARALGVLRTPTVVAFDRSGAEFVRVSGLPRAAELQAALAPVLDAR